MSDNAKTLLSNWFEERCTEGYDNSNKSATYMKHPLAGKYVTSGASYGEFTKQKDPILQDTKFYTSTENWMNFQPAFKPKETYKTTFGCDYEQPANQKGKFQLKDTSLTADKKALEEYKKTWTQAGHNFNRTYLGAKQFKKVNQDGQ